MAKEKATFNRQIADALPRIEEELHQLEHQAGARERIHALQQVQDSFRELLGLPVGIRLPLSAREGILRLTSREPRSWHVKELVEAMEAHGWLGQYSSPYDTLFQAAKRLAADGQLRHTGPATYERAWEEGDG